MKKKSSLKDLLKSKKYTGNGVGYRAAMGESKTIVKRSLKDYDSHAAKENKYLHQHKFM